jgi:hypothetical protein
MPCFQVFLESSIKVGSLPLPIDKKLKKIIETKLREGIEKTMLLPHQLRIPLKPVGPTPSSVATQWSESDLLEGCQSVQSDPGTSPFAAAGSLSAGDAARCPDSPSVVSQAEYSSDSDSGHD